ncbi:putative Protein phosphatase 2C [Monocercomonoides exilis]|uniref:putative Protein phosphatase 2C n=1 Tax=Monocercomonoides exilis TaxID=2049356 RepID=UPI003559D60E|nr:putative Protein phosphatase 2C [Monocercomonoides exilis]
MERDPDELHTEISVDHHLLGLLAAASCSITGDGRYTYNQDETDVKTDFLDMVPGSLYVALFDGHGNLPFTNRKSGGAISTFVKENLRQHLTHELKKVYVLAHRGLYRARSLSHVPLRSSKALRQLSPSLSFIHSAKPQSSLDGFSQIPIKRDNTPLTTIHHEGQSDDIQTNENNPQNGSDAGKDKENSQTENEKEETSKHTHSTSSSSNNESGSSANLSLGSSTNESSKTSPREDEEGIALLKQFAMPSDGDGREMGVFGLPISAASSLDAYSIGMSNLHVDPQKIEEAIYSGFRKTNDDLKEFLKNNNLTGEGSGGTTAIVAVVLYDELYVASVGDSLAVLGCYTESDVGVEPLNRRHHWCWADESSRIREKKGTFVQCPSGGYLVEEQHRFCLSMSRSMGDFEYESVGLVHLPDITRHSFTGWREFALLLASDGVSDVLTGEECIRLLGEHYNHFIETDEADTARRTAIVSEAAHFLVKRAEEEWEKTGAGADTDNISVCVVFFPHVPLLPPHVAMAQSLDEVAAEFVRNQSPERSTGKKDHPIKHHHLRLDEDGILGEKHLSNSTRDKQQQQQQQQLSGAKYAAHKSHNTGKYSGDESAHDTKEDQDELNEADTKQVDGYEDEESDVLENTDNTSSGRAENEKREHKSSLSVLTSEESVPPILSLMHSIAIDSIPGAHREDKVTYDLTRKREEDILYGAEGIGGSHL